VNATHYRLPTAAMVNGWRAAVGPDFRFAIKAHRRLTDAGSIRWDDAQRAFLDRFVASLAPLGSSLGVVLLQFADDQQRDDDGLRSVLDALPDWLPVAFELRHPSWHHPDVDTLLAAHARARCLTDTDATPVAPPSGPLAYVRLRATHYDTQAREQWRDLLLEQATERPVYVVCRHQDIPAGDPHAGVGMAIWLQQHTRNE
jgi:uncharacterized protein YecE (DUF72 family)